MQACHLCFRAPLQLAPAAPAPWLSARARSAAPQPARQILIAARRSLLNDGRLASLCNARLACLWPAQEHHPPCLPALSFWHLQYLSAAKTHQCKGDESTKANEIRQSCSVAYWYIQEGLIELGAAASNCCRCPASGEHRRCSGRLAASRLLLRGARHSRLCNGDGAGGAGQRHCHLHPRKLRNGGQLALNLRGAALLNKHVCQRAALVKLGAAKGVMARRLTGGESWGRLLGKARRRAGLLHLARLPKSLSTPQPRPGPLRPQRISTAATRATPSLEQRDVDLGAQQLEQLHGVGGALDLQGRRQA